MINYRYRTLPVILAIVFFYLTTMLFLPLPAGADVVSAQMYRQNSTRVIIEVVLAKSGPSSLIVQMRLPLGIIVEQTNPAVSKYTKRTNTLKWLFKEVQPGSLSIAITSQQTYNIDDSPVLVRYRSRQDQSVIEVPARTR